MLLNLCTIILLFLLSCTDRRCANLPRMSVRAYGSIKRKKEKRKKQQSKWASQPQPSTIRREIKPCNEHGAKYPHKLSRVSEFPCTNCGTSFVDLLCFCYVFCLLCLCARLFICALWSPAGKGLTSWLSFVVSNCEFVTFPLVSWVRCGT